MIVGWYYLHENMHLIYKPDSDGVAADIRESPFALALWPCDLKDRANAWSILVEALSFGAKPDRVAELAAKWGCDDADAAIFADRVQCLLSKDGNQWSATRKDFVDLQQSPAGFGDSALAAMANLCKALGLRPGKMWNPHFIDVLQCEPAMLPGCISR